MSKASIHTIPDWKLESLQARIEKLNKRAKRLKLEPITIRQTGKEEILSVERDGIERKQRWIEIEVCGQDPKLPGWQFAAQLDHEGEFAIINKNPFFEREIPTSWRAVKSDCGHCQKYRNRNNTFLLCKDDASFMQVGRQCLKDFLGHEDPEMLAASFELLHEVQCCVTEAEFDDSYDQEGAYGRAREVFSVASVLSIASRSVEIDGYLSSTKARETGQTSTKELVIEHTSFNPLYASAKNRAEHEKRTPHEGNNKEAQNVIEWVRSWNPANLSDYEHNVFVALSADYTKENRFGIIVSAISAYQKHLGRQAEKANKLNEHFGAPGERIELNLTLVREFSFETNFGTKTIYTFEDEAGRTFVWKSSSSCSLESGKTYKLRATIKSHSEYDGRGKLAAPIKQTEITRAKVATSEPEFVFRDQWGNPIDSRGRKTGKVAA